MIEQEFYVVVKTPETAEYIVYKNETTSNFVSYQSSDSLLPSSLDQIMKNGTIIYGHSCMTEKQG